MSQVDAVAGVIDIQKGPAAGSTPDGCRRVLLFMAAELSEHEWWSGDQIRAGAGCDDADLHNLRALGQIELDGCGCGFWRLTDSGLKSSRLAAASS